MVKTSCIYATEHELLAEFARILQTAANEAIESRNIFTIGLSGSSMVQQIARTLPNICSDLSKWKFFFCDERVVPFSDSESTCGSYLKALKDIKNITEDQFIAINPDFTAEEAAKDYAKKIATFFPNQDVPKFDMILLGMGPDGHTCSLFPDHPLLEETSAWVAPITDSPKPPPNRVTFTYLVINNARRCVFLALGENKAEAVKKIFKDNVPLPANRVSLVDGEVLWLLDQKAASLLS